MKKFILLLLSLLLIISGCTSNQFKEDPEISLDFSISNLTDDDYQSVGTQHIKKPSKADFRNVDFNFEIKHSDKIKNRKVTIPDIEKILHNSSNGTDEEKLINLAEVLKFK